MIWRLLASFVDIAVVVDCCFSVAGVVVILIVAVVTGVCKTNSVLVVVCCRKNTGTHIATPFSLQTPILTRMLWSSVSNLLLLSLAA